MLPLAAIVLFAALLAGFLFLTAVEKRRGSRVLAPLRARLDVYTADAALKARSLNGGVLRKRASVIGAYLVHEVVHGVLVAVRALERLLTNTVRALRARHGVTPPAPLVEETKTVE